MKQEYIRQRDRRIKLIVGLLFIFTLSVGFTLSWLNKGNVSALQNTITIQASTDSAQGLSSGKVVSLVGIPIGHIEQIELRDDNKIWLSMAVFGRYHQKVKKDSQLHINSSVIGSIKLDFDLGTEESPPIEQGDILNTVKAQAIDDIIGNIPAIQLQLGQLLTDASMLVRHLSALDGPLNQGFSRLDVILSQVEDLAINLNSTLPGILNNVDKLTVDLGQLTNALSDPQSGIPRTLASSQQLIVTLENTVQQKNQEVSELLESIDPVLNNVEKLSVELGQLTTTLNNPQSGIPKALSSSQQLIVTLENTVQQKNQEVTDLLRSIDQVLNNVDTLLKTMHEISDELEQVAPQAPELIQQVKDTLEQSNSMIRALKSSALLHSVFEEPKIDDMLIESPRDEITQ